jgi:hypothetical protein
MNRTQSFDELYKLAVLSSLLIGGAIGYYLGANSPSQAPTSPTSPQSSRDSFAQRAPVVQELKVDDTDDEVDAESTVNTQGLGSVKASLFEECKLVRYTHPRVLIMHAAMNGPT